MQRSLNFDAPTKTVLDALLEVMSDRIPRAAYEIQMLLQQRGYNFSESNVTARIRELRRKRGLTVECTCERPGRFVYRLI